MRSMISSGVLRYIADKDRDVWFCNCKQTANRPFCDGTHREERIQAERIDGKSEQIWEPTEKQSQ